MVRWGGLQYFTTVCLLLTVEDACCYRMMSLCRYRSCDPEQEGYAGKSLFKETVGEGSEVGYVPGK